MYTKGIRLWLTGVLLFFPFLTFFTRNFKGQNEYDILIKSILYLDEITIAVIFFFAIRESYKNKEILNPIYLVFFIQIAFFCFFGLMSGIFNGNSYTVNILGTINYVKSFSVIFIYATFFRGFNDFRKIFRLLFLVGIFLSAGVMVEEIWALSHRYILGKDILDPDLYLFSNASALAWRFGILRASFILSNKNVFGYFILFIFTIYIFTNRKTNPFIIVLLLSGILFTASRNAYGGLLAVLGLFLIIRKLHSNKIIVAYVSLALIVAAVVGIYPPDVDNLGLKENNKITYREFARNKSMEIWKDHPLLGVGPGMFGGVISKKIVSPIYAEYNYPFKYIKGVGGIDQYWPQVLAETGVIGFALFVALNIVLLYVLWGLKKDEKSDDINGLMTGLLTFWIVVYVYTFGTGFNTVSVIFPYFAFIGICISTIINSRKEGGKETEIK